MRSVGQALELYKDRHREVFPIAKYMPNPWLSGSRRPGFNDAMVDFLDRESPAYKCPGDREIFSVPWQDRSGPTPVDRIGGMSYTYVTAFRRTRRTDLLRRVPETHPEQHADPL